MAESKKDIPMGIPESFKGKSIFITGFTGFIGQLLVEKILFSCPDVKQIYVLVRSKKGEDPKQRAQKVIDSRTFNRVREKDPDLLTKITAFPGDVKEYELGLSEEHIEILTQNINIIIHGAASVRFDESLNDALQMNTNGTKSVVDLALKMPHLICFTYMSTAYSNCYQQNIKEEMYPPKADWKKSLTIAKKIDPAVLQILQEKYIEGLPNTYSFTKHLAEYVIDDYKHQLPVVIVRPSVVVSACKEPSCGWTGTKFGPGGIMIAYFLGISRCNYMAPNEKTNCIFSDIVVNATIAGTSKKIVSSNCDKSQDILPIYNICEPDWFSLTNQKYATLYLRNKMIDSLQENRINFLSVSVITSEWSYKLQNLYRHVFPAFIIDQILKVAGMKPMLLQVRKTLFNATLMIAFFLTRTFYFNTENFDNLVNDMTPEDKESFGWDFTKYDIYDIYYQGYLDVKKTFMKPLFKDLDTNRKRLMMLYIMDRSVVFLTYGIVAGVVYKLGIPHILLTSLAKFFMLQ